MIKSEKKAPVPTRIMPYDPENIHLTKAQFLEKSRKDKERQAAIKAFTEELDTKIPSANKPIVAEVPDIAPVVTTAVHEKPIGSVKEAVEKKRGRPKKQE